MAGLSKIGIALFCALSSTLFFIGCGGCGGCGDTSSSANRNEISSGILNADLSGKLLFEHDNNAWLMDMSSGQYSKIPNTYWVTHDHIFGNCDDFWLDMGPNNNEFMVTSLDDCSTTGPYYRYESIRSNPSGRIVNKHFSDTISWIP